MSATVPPEGPIPVVCSDHKGCSLRPITIAECRAFSDELSKTNEVHRRNRDLFSPGKKYSNRADDPRVFIDAVFIPDGYHMPDKLRSWFGKGGGHSSHGDPGTWMLNVGVPAKSAEPSLFGEVVA